MKSASKNYLELSVVIPALHEAPNLAVLLPTLTRLLNEITDKFEILIVTRGTDPETIEVAAKSSAKVIEQTERGYGGALLAGFKQAGGQYIITMDADLSHPATFIKDLWKQRNSAEVVIASRYVPGGKAEMPQTRFVLSRILNKFFARGLSLPLRDLSSGFRLYRADLVRALALSARDFDVLPEILVRLYADGWHILEVPFAYAPRQYGSSNARVFAFGMAYLKTFGVLWKLRNSVLSADYDDRAYNSIIPLQRYWQRSRYKHITELSHNEGRVLDVGCGSSKIIGALPENSVALDILIRKLRYARKFNRLLVHGSGYTLPFPDESFPCVVCSQVIEHIPRNTPVLTELDRVLAPGGRLVLGTPDYDRWEWVWIEKLYGWFAPNAYADEHITHYTYDQLKNIYEERGYELEEARYILRGELIMAFRKRGTNNKTLNLLENNLLSTIS